MSSRLLETHLAILQQLVSVMQSDNAEERTLISTAF